MEACPHCGFTNKPNATRCECCLAELGEAEPIRAAAPAAAAASAPRVSTAASGSTRGATPAPFHPVEPGEPAPQLSVQPPGISPEVGGRGAKLVLALVVVGVLCGIWLLRPQPGKPSLARTILDGTKHEQAARPGTPAPEVPASNRRVRRRGVVSMLVAMLFSEKSASPAQPAAPPDSQPPVAETREPAAGPPANVPATRSATPATPPGAAGAPAPAGGAPAVPTVEPEEAAGALYRAAVTYLKRNQVEKARNALQEITRKYPQTTAAGQAQDLLSQLPMLTPAQPPPPNAGVSTAAARPRPTPSASRPVEPPSAPSPATGGPERPTPRKPVIPPSLLASQAPVPASAAARDEVRVTGALREDRSVVITLDCVLDSAHSRPVFLGAWLRDASGMQRVGYAATRISSGRSAPKLTLMNVPDTLTQLRVVLFEENGALFLTRDFTLSK